ncbi:MAG: hypothetical protein CVT67_00335 [Actinobacteria bacterium HGW-Actinobacteria-7]|nr:MAG: hypothetical protein CVT67_00335 [Actinobacteria bacterium HGW-Actinobacteria-7]
MPIWAVIVTIIGTIALMAALAAAAWYGWRTFERRSLLRIVVRTEAVEAAGQALFDVFSRLAEAGDEELTAFADEPESSERRALYEVALKADMISDELDRMRLPRSLIAVAGSVADAAFLVSKEARAVDESDTGDVALEHMSAVDLATVRAYTDQARRRVHESCVECGLEETNVYGGGLYL